MPEIQDWMNKIRQGIWTGLGASAKDIMQVWAVRMVAQMKAFAGYPSPPPISKLSGRLARAIQGQAESTDGLKKTDTEITYERTLQVPYAAISEYGKKVSATDAMRRAMFAKLKSMGQYKREHARIGMGKKGMFEHNPYYFVRDSIEQMTADMIEPAVEKHVKEQLNKIPNLEVVIGNK